MNAQGKQYGRKNLGAALQRSRAQNPAQIAEGIGEDLAAFAGQSRPHDDRTVLVIKKVKP
jgi:serine phosphatase RsbU (regulator of sigma subunit)